MVFSSLVFLFVFLPVVIICYACAPRRIKNLILFVFSLIFYAWGEPVYIVLMLITTVADYGFGLLLSRPKLSLTQRKTVVILSVIINLSILSFFKYADFIIVNVNALMNTTIPLTDLPLPIGISFYIFQSLSYIIDVYRRDIEAQRNWIDFATYVAMFPQLVAGPIVQYGTIAKQLGERSVSVQLFAAGVRRFIIGLAKKVLLANNIGLLWTTISTSNVESMPVLTAWLGIIAFAFQIYFDFSGYSDMAIGLGMMFGFKFNENFNYPYVAQSITEFWRRWHISLGSWFRQYVYIPLGGNRRGLRIQIRNIIIVWMLTGIWHGASWNFLIWGLYFGVILMLEKWWVLKALAQLPRWTRHVYALLLILIGWVCFAFEQFTIMVSYLWTMFAWLQKPLWNDETIYLLYTNGFLIILLVLASMPFKSWIKVNWHGVIQLGWLGVLFVLCIAYLVDGTFNPFLYFRF